MVKRRLVDTTVYSESEGEETNVRVRKIAVAVKAPVQSRTYEQRLGKDNKRTGELSTPGSEQQQRQRPHAYTPSSSSSSGSQKSDDSSEGGETREERDIYEAETNNRSVFELSETGSSRIVLASIDRHLEGLQSPKAGTVQRRRCAWALFETFVTTRNMAFTCRTTGTLQTLLAAVERVLQRERDGAVRAAVLALLFLLVQHAHDGAGGGGGSGSTPLLSRRLFRAILTPAAAATAAAATTTTVAIAVAVGMTTPSADTHGRATSTMVVPAVPVMTAVSSFHLKRRKVSAGKKSALYKTAAAGISTSSDCSTALDGAGAGAGAGAGDGDSAVALATVVANLRRHWPQLTTFMWGAADLCPPPRDDALLPLLIANRILAVGSRRAAATATTVAQNQNGGETELTALQLELGAGSVLTDMARSALTDVDVMVQRCDDVVMHLHRDGAVARVWLWLGLIESGCFRCPSNQSVVLQSDETLRSLARLLQSFPLQDDGRVPIAHVTTTATAASTPVAVGTTRVKHTLSASHRQDLTERMRSTFPELYASSRGAARPALALALAAEDAEGVGSTQRRDCRDGADHEHEDGESRCSSSSAREGGGISIGLVEICMSCLRVLATVTHNNVAAPSLLAAHGVVETCVLTLEGLMRRRTELSGSDDAVTPGANTQLESLFFVLTILTNVAETDADVCADLGARLGGPLLELLLHETRPIMADIEETEVAEVEKEAGGTAAESEGAGACAGTRADSTALMERVPVGEIILSAHCAALLFTLSRAPSVCSDAFLSRLPRRSWWLCVRMLKALVCLQGQTGVMVVDSVLPILEIIASMEQEDPLLRDGYRLVFEQEDQRVQG